MRVVTVVLSLVLAHAGTVAAGERVRLSTTTSTESSGLLDVLLPPFEERFGYEVAVIAVGSGKALELGRNGDVDLVLSHAPELEDAFVEAGFGVNRREVMYNDFVIVGPPDDPAGLRGLGSGAAALRRLAEKRAIFVSRGDESGTHQMEKTLWAAASRVPDGDWYVSTGQGMGPVLLMTDERRGHALADRGTFLAYRRKGDLVVLVEGDPAMINPYTVLAVNPARHAHVKYVPAMTLIAWMTSREGQVLIGGFRVDEQRLFHPVAVPPAPVP